MSKTAFLDQLEGAALQSKAYTEAACAEITQAMAGELAKKQGKLTGTQGQVLGFDAQGQAVAQDAPQTGLTQTQADGRYLKLSGGTMTGALSVPEPTQNSHSATKKYVDDAVAALRLSVPAGAIVIWSGTADNIPADWQLCDGTNGTPDLRDKFVLGAGSTYPAGGTGGESTHKLTNQEIPPHSHAQNSCTIYQSPAGSYNIQLQENDDYLGVEVGSYKFGEYEEPNYPYTNTAGDGQPHNNMPPYYTLCYIQKMTADKADGVTMAQVNVAINAAITGAVEEAY